MKRFAITPRPNWQQTVEQQGLIWHTANGAPYWSEEVGYSFTSSDIDRLYNATQTLYDMFLNAGQYIVDKKLYNLFGIPESFWPLVEQAWNSSPPCLNYGRFDLGYDGRTEPKLLEFNCDTPTSLLEAAVVQWTWMEEQRGSRSWDQWNSIHDKIVAKWRDITPYLPSQAVYFAHTNDAAGEDSVTTAYLADTATEAGLEARPIVMTDIGFDTAQQCFVDLEEEPMQVIYKLYPWEWMVQEEFGTKLLTNDTTVWIEPIWKMIWSNKAILPILWDMYPRHPNLLWATRDAPADVKYVKKPILAREGANIEWHDGSTTITTYGAYSDSPVIYQGLYDLPNFDGNYPVIGAWIVDGEPAGMGIREDGLITSNLARFVPHVIED